MTDHDTNTCIACGERFNPRRGPRTGLTATLYCVGCRPKEERRSINHGRQYGSSKPDNDYHGSYTE